MFNPKVSVIIMSYNQDEYIDSAIKSVINQTYKNLEIIISDNGSTDKSKEIIENHANRDSRIIYLDYPENNKITVRQNKAAQVSTGDYISLLYGDDYYLEEKIYSQVKIFENLSSDWGVVHGPGFREDVDTSNRVFSPVTKAHGESFLNLLENFTDGFINPISPLVSRECYLSNKSFEELFTEGEGVFFRFALRYKFFYLDEPLVVMREHKTNMGKAIIKNGDVHSFCMKKIAEDPDFPIEFIKPLKKHESNHMFGVGFECIRGNLNVKRGVELIRQSAKIYLPNFFRVKFLCVYLLSFFPIIMIRKMMIFLSYILNWDHQKSLEDYYS
jgi:alpha-1,3-rhamnosyltransferase